MKTRLGVDDSDMASTHQTLSSVLQRNLLFVHGKGGVGKTTVSQAIALALAQKGHRTLWISIEDPTRPAGELKEIRPDLWHLNCDFQLAFEEYAAMKIKTTRLTQLFLQNRLMQYLAKAAPGIRELVLLGKTWFERTHYEHVIVDMPSTGYGLAMFQSTENFIKLFSGGPLFRDAEAMLETLRDPKTTGHLIVSLPEEMPLQESLELNEYLLQNFPNNPAAFLVNRLFPHLPFLNTPGFNPETRKSPLAESKLDYAQTRSWLEHHNLRLWNEAGVKYGHLSFVPPPLENALSVISERLSHELSQRSYL